MADKYLDYAGLSVYTNKIKALIPDVSGKEDTSNKVTAMSASSTDTQYPSAKCVYDAIGVVSGNIPTKTSDLTNNGNGGGNYYALATEQNAGFSIGNGNTVRFFRGSTDCGYAEKTENKVTVLSGSSTDTEYPSAKLVYEQLATKQRKLTAGTNITINNGTISATDTTYSPFTGTDGTAAGTNGLVPGPATTDAGKFLNADGTWATPPGTTYTAGTRITIDPNDNNKISTTAEINKIETVKVDGTALTITSKAVNITGKENTSNKVTSLSSSSTDTQYPSAKCVYDFVDTKISSTYKAKGSCTFANKPTLAAAHEGEVWNISDAFTTTSDFVEGAGNTYPAGTNIVVVNTGTSQSPVWKYDVLAGFVDLSSYMLKTDMVAITTAEINALFS